MPFPPETKEAQLDEKWSFVGKKQKHCKEGEDEYGNNWDYVAYDPVNKLVISVVPGKRNTENTNKVVGELKKRTGGKLLDLIVTDEYKPYKEAILYHYGDEIPQERNGKTGRLPKSKYEAPKGLNYAVVHKTRKKGRVVNIELKTVFGEDDDIKKALQNSRVSQCVNTAFVERYNATDRHQNARKARRTYRFSKKWNIHNVVTFLICYCYNFCWPVRTLRIPNQEGKYQQRTPAMSAKLTDHIWTIREWLKMPCVQLE